jgi:hypothetical protein
VKFTISTVIASERSERGNLLFTGYLRLLTCPPRACVRGKCAGGARVAPYRGSHACLRISSVPDGMGGAGNDITSLKASAWFSICIAPRLCQISLPASLLRPL